MTSRREIERWLEQRREAGLPVDPDPSDAPIDEAFARLIPPWRWDEPLGDVVHLVKKAEYGEFESEAAREWFERHAPADEYDHAGGDGSVSGDADS